MIYEIRQVTSYSYGSFVPFASHVLRLIPLPGPGLEVLECDVIVDPQPSEYSVAKDFFGNSITHISLRSAHRRLEIESRALLRLLLPEPRDPASTPPWEEVREAAQRATSLGPRSPAHQLFATPHVPIDADLAAYGEPSFTPGRPILDGAIDLMHRIRNEFQYDPEATNVRTSARDAFALRRGVCQDFAHVMIGAMRSLGLPAAYVSGYLRTVPREGMPRLMGADAMHAWVSVWCGREAGWQDLDPTNAMRIGRDHIPLAFGRDYIDVSPVDGVIYDSGDHTLNVAVDVIERTPST